jgi:hypothetical protein
MSIRSIVVISVVIASGCTTLGLPRTPVSAESPNRRFVAFVRNHPNIDPPDQSIWLTDRSGDTMMLRRLGGDTEWCRHVVWSADSSTVGFLIMDTKLETYDVATRRLRTSTWLNGHSDDYPPGGTVIDLTLSPDGSMASFKTCAGDAARGSCSDEHHVVLSVAGASNGLE